MTENKDWKKAFEDRFCERNIVNVLGWSRDWEEEVIVEPKDVINWIEREIIQGE